MTDSLATLCAAHASGKAATATIEETYARIARHNDPALFIALRPKPEALAIASRLEGAGREGKPLFGAPFVVKDNIDVAGLPTTAACPAFAYQPEHRRSSSRELERRRGDRDRQDQPRSVRDRPRRRAFALRRPAQRVAAPTSFPAARAQARRRRSAQASSPFRSAPTRPDLGGSGGPQRDRRIETLARRAFCVRGRAGLPHARHDLDLRARRRRRRSRCSRRRAPTTKHDAIRPTLSRRRRCRAFATD